MVKRDTSVLCQFDIIASLFKANVFFSGDEEQLLYRRNWKSERKLRRSSQASVEENFLSMIENSMVFDNSVLSNVVWLQDRNSKRRDYCGCCKSPAKDAIIQTGARYIPLRQRKPKWPQFFRL
jgi:hypothetical protein